MRIIKWFFLTLGVIFFIFVMLGSLGLKEFRMCFGDAGQCACVHEAIGDAK